MKVKSHMQCSCHFKHFTGVGDGKHLRSHILYTGDGDVKRLAAVRQLKEQITQR